MDPEQQYREDIVLLGRMLHQKGYIAASDGNLSVRLDKDRVLATPTGASKGMMEPDDPVIVDLQGQRIAGRRAVSSEIGMHLLIYRLRRDIRGVVHAHPPTATAYASAGIELNQALLAEVVLSLGHIPLARYARPGTAELSAALEPFIPDHDSILMANHGVVTYGDSLLRAYLNMETVEHFAKITLVTHLLGKEQLLSATEVERLAAVRPGANCRQTGGALGRMQDTTDCPCEK